jgi:hypothetical protein
MDRDPLASMPPQASHPCMDPRSQEELIALLRWQYHRSRLRDLGDLRAKVILQVQVT